MPRSGPNGTASQPPGSTPQQPNTKILSAIWNSVINDIYQIFNTKTPIAYGGTNAETPVEAADNLSTKGSDIASASTTNIWGASGGFVHITGTTAITSFGSSSAAGNERTIVFDGALTLTHNATTLILPGGENITTTPGAVAVVRSEGGANARVVSYTSGSSIVTPWVIYSPAFTGFGTVSSPLFSSRRVGDTLEVRGTFAAGTTTATEARISLGFNGINGGIVSSGASKIPARGVAGSAVGGLNTTAIIYCLIEQSVGYMTFGIQSAGTAAYNKANGDAITTSGNALSILASIPINGW